MQPEPRYNTDISYEHFYKYKPPDRKLMFARVLHGDDRNVLQKVVESTTSGAMCAAVASVFAVGPPYKPGESFTYSKAVENLFKHCTPFIISGAMYGLGVGITAKVRDKNDFVNHLVGGLASGSMMGHWYKSMRIGTWSCLFLCSMGGLYKFVNDNGFVGSYQHRRPREFDWYRINWFGSRPDPEGLQDGALDDTYKKYKA